MSGFWFKFFQWQGIVALALYFATDDQAFGVAALASLIMADINKH